MKGSRIFTRK